MAKTIFGRASNFAGSEFEAIREISNGPITFGPPSRIRTRLTSNVIFRVLMAAVLIAGAGFGAKELFSPNSTWLIAIGATLFALSVVQIIANANRHFKTVRNITLDAKGIIITEHGGTEIRRMWHEISDLKITWTGARRLYDRTGENYFAYGAAIENKKTLDSVIQSVSWLYKSINLRKNPYADAWTHIQRVGLNFPPREDTLRQRQLMRKLSISIFAAVTIATGYILYYRQFGPAGMLLAITTLGFAVRMIGLSFFKRLAPDTVRLDSDGLTAFHKRGGRRHIDWKLFDELEVGGDGNRWILRHRSAKIKIIIFDNAGEALLRAHILNAIKYASTDEEHEEAA